MFYTSYLPFKIKFKHAIILLFFIMQFYSVLHNYKRNLQLSTAMQKKSLQHNYKNEIYICRLPCNRLQHTCFLHYNPSVVIIHRLHLEYIPTRSSLVSFSATLQTLHTSALYRAGRGTDFWFWY